MKKIIKVISLVLFFEIITSVYTTTFDSFIVTDKTNETEFVEDVFDCWQFTETFIGNARFYGFEAYPVYAVLEKDGKFYSHAFVQITANDVVYWIEPQNDLFYKVIEEYQPLCFTDGRCIADRFVFHVDYTYSQHQ